MRSIGGAADDWFKVGDGGAEKALERKVFAIEYIKGSPVEKLSIEGALREGEFASIMLPVAADMLGTSHARVGVAGDVP